jgi:hypothetical protein
VPHPHRPDDDEQRERAERQVQPEDPAPGRRVRERAAQQRPGDRRERPHRADEPLVAAALAGREEVCDRRLGEREQPAGAEALHDARPHELADVLGDRAQQRSDEEDRYGDDEHRPAPVDVAEPPVQRHGHRGRHEVGGDDPRQVVERPQVGDDPGQRRGHDRLVDRREQRREHDPRVGGDDRPARQRGRRARHRYGTQRSPTGVTTSSWVSALRSWPAR